MPCLFLHQVPVFLFDLFRPRKERLNKKLVESKIYISNTAPSKKSSMIFVCELVVSFFFFVAKLHFFCSFANRK